MDKKAKKKVQVLNQKIQQLELQLAGARKQHDDLAEIQALEQRLKEAREQLSELKNA